MVDRAALSHSLLYSACTKFSLLAALSVDSEKSVFLTPKGKSDSSNEKIEEKSAFEAEIEKLKFRGQFFCRIFFSKLFLSENFVFLSENFSSSFFCRNLKQFFVGSSSEKRNFLSDRVA